jgi:hypothetical protein
MVVEYSTDGGTFSAGRPRQWSPTQIRRNLGIGTQNFDVSPDGKRVVMFPRPTAEETEGLAACDVPAELLRRSAAPDPLTAEER